MNMAIISLLVSNKYGVLGKVTGLFSRRGYNIAALSGGETEDPALSRIIVSTREGDAQRLEYIRLQLSKLEDVKTAELLSPDNMVQRELALVKLKPAPGQEELLASLTQLFEAKTIQAPDECVILELTAPTHRIDQFLERARAGALQIVEMSRSGVAALRLGGEPPCEH